MTDRQLRGGGHLMRGYAFGEALPDVAVASGFKNYSNFGAQFRRAIGISPRDYRQSS